MCGIWVLVGHCGCGPRHLREFLKISARGPDLTTLQEVSAKGASESDGESAKRQDAKSQAWFGFHRLAIVTSDMDQSKSNQPIRYGNLSAICNGEIYNHKEVKLSSDIEPGGGMENEASDCAAVLHAYKAQNGNIVETCHALDGVYAFAICDGSTVYIGRDPIGVRPLFFGFTEKGEFICGSEIKSIVNLCTFVTYFPPGCCATIPVGNPSEIQIIRHYLLPSQIYLHTSERKAVAAIRQILTSSVQKRLMANKRFGFLLSGGLDSSLIASIAVKMLQSSQKNFLKPIAFCVGFEDSEDLRNAKLVADYLDIELRTLIITPEDCLNAVEKVVYALETTEHLLIRCGVPHYLLCQYISRNTDVKVLLSGEGADELYGSYRYMQRAPSPMLLHQEMVRRLSLLHHYDVLRCDRATSCHGLEIRVPFLDKQFVDFVATLPPTYKLAQGLQEKHILRKAFDGWLPNQVLWRKKEGFSDALGKTDLGQVIEEHASGLISEDDFNARHSLYPTDTPTTKEEFWFRTIFESHFGYQKLANCLHTKVYKTAPWILNNDNNNNSSTRHRKFDNILKTDAIKVVTG